MAAPRPRAAGGDDVADLDLPGLAVDVRDQTEAEELAVRPERREALGGAVRRPSSYLVQPGRANPGGGGSGTRV